jgi:hypothetical protein
MINAAVPELFTAWPEWLPIGRFGSITPVRI